LYNQQFINLRTMFIQLLK